MAMVNPVEKANALRDELLEKRDAKISKLNSKIEELKQQAEAEEAAMNEATSSLNVTAYIKAKANKEQAETLAKMYTGKLDEVRRADMISEEDSDKVIRDIWKYEDDLTEKYLNDAVEHIKALLDLSEKYNNAIRNSHYALQMWAGNVRAFYNPDAPSWNNGKLAPSPVIRTKQEASELTDTTNKYKSNEALMKRVNALKD